MGLSSGGVFEDNQEDPDFEYREVDDDLAGNIDEFKNNRSTKIPQKEVEALMQELFDAYELDKTVDLSSSSGAGKRSKKPSGGGKDILNGRTDTSPSGPRAVEEGKSVGEAVTVLSEDQRSLLAQQMRQHTQLLTQMALLSAKDPKLADVHSHAKEMMGDLVQGSFKCQYSMFAQDTLFPSLRLIEEWSANTLPSSETVTKIGQKDKHEISPYLVEKMANERVFLYPSLLPTSGLHLGGGSEGNSSSTYWSTGEDQLIILALQEADTEGGEASSGSGKNVESKNTRAFNSVHQNIMKGTKSVAQIRARVKNSTKQKLMQGYMVSGDSVTASTPGFNALRHFKKYRKVLPLAGSEVIHYDPSVPLTHVPLEQLPTFWRESLKRLRPESACQPPLNASQAVPYADAGGVTTTVGGLTPAPQQSLFTVSILPPPVVAATEAQIHQFPKAMVQQQLPHQQAVVVTESPCEPPTVAVTSGQQGFSMPNLLGGSPMKTSFTSDPSKPSVGSGSRFRPIFTANQPVATTLAQSEPKRKKKNLRKKPSPTSITGKGVTSKVKQKSNPFSAGVVSGHSPFLLHIFFKLVSPL